jgi:hypothetical protein
MIEQVTKFIIPAAFALLPASMNSQSAKAILLAIGLQESRFLHRRQENFGPARGFWQFEKGGVRGVCRHLKTRQHLEDALRLLRYEKLIGAKMATAELHYALEDNDVLAAVFARLLLWTIPGPLPGPTDEALAWDQYLECWRPGKPYRATWKAFFGEAWDRVLEVEKT